MFWLRRMTFQYACRLYLHGLLSHLKFLWGPEGKFLFCLTRKWTSRFSLNVQEQETVLGFSELCRSGAQMTAFTSQWYQNRLLKNPWNGLSVWLLLLCCAATPFWLSYHHVSQYITEKMGQEYYMHRRSSYRDRIMSNWNKASMFHQTSRSAKSPKLHYCHCFTISTVSGGKLGFTELTSHLCIQKPFSLFSVISRDLDPFQCSVNKSLFSFIKWTAMRVKMYVLTACRSQVLRILLFSTLLL